MAYALDVSCPVITGTIETERLTVFSILTPGHFHSKSTPVFHTFIKPYCQCAVLVFFCLDRKMSELNVEEFVEKTKHAFTLGKWWLNINMLWDNFVMQSKPEAYGHNAPHRVKNGLK